MLYSAVAFKFSQTLMFWVKFSFIWICKWGRTAFPIFKTERKVGKLVLSLGNEIKERQRPGRPGVMGPE